MKSSIYEYDRYKSFVNDLIASMGPKARGIKKSLADSLNCQSPFVSQVLSGDLDFSPDQALACAQFFGLGPDETEYFLLLVSVSRAVTPALRKHLQAALLVKKETFREIKSRMKMKDSLDREYQMIYYSSWIYSAIHMTLTIPEFRTREALSERLKLPISVINEAVNFLVEIGMVEKDGTALNPTGKWYHLEKTSPMIKKHHTNLLIRAIDSLDQPQEHDLHYSAFFSCSRKDLKRLEEMLLKTLSEFNELVRPSKEEELFAISLNLFRG